MTTMERGQRLRLILNALGPLGETMAEAEGKPIAVFGGIPGEEVVAEVIAERRQHVAAVVVEVVTPSPHRVQPPCPYFGACTGCQWQHISYQHQLDLKRQTVADALQHVGGLDGVEVRPALPSPKELGYRNHARFTVGRREGVLGFVNRETRRFIEIQDCMIMDPWINGAMRKLRGHCRETSQLSIRYGSNSGDYLIQPALHDAAVDLATGQKHYTEAVKGVPFRVASPSFFQVNTAQAERMADLVRDALALSGKETVVDAYAGVGTFAALLAPHAAQVLAIEESSSAIKDAQVNLAPFPNVSIVKGRTEELLGQLGPAVDAVVLDPPRVGCLPEALEALKRLAPARIAYVSCDPASLARDLKVLAGGPFQVEWVQPLDMFPQTHHVESIALLTLRQGHPIVLASSSPRRKSILEESRLPFQVIPPVGDEAAPQGARPEEYVQGVALAKAREVAGRMRRGMALAADTAVVAGDRVLGKPKDAEEALAMLLALRGRRHRVMTGVALVDPVTGAEATGVVVSWVSMRDYSEAEAWAFVDSGGALDKAGAYAIQDPVFRPAESVEGCYLNVVGLPMCLATRLLRRFGADMGRLCLPEECAAHRQEGDPS
ncbi:MAG: septum formation protein Maf [Chloroflexi bacterium]|nr:septum formation protein Maf [Chloroflexota bacterium]